jgi:hypothetical protein
MLKFLFWILIVANSTLLAFRFGYLESLLPGKSEPQRLSQQLNADKIKLIPVTKPASAVAVASTSAASAVASAPSAAGAQASVSAPSVPVAPPAPAPEKANKLVACTEVGTFASNETKKFESRLTSLALGERMTKRSIQEVATHMVFIPPQTSKEGAEKKASELKKLGVTNFFIIQDNSKLRWGISLGVFKTEAAAKKYLASLSKQGVRSARVGARSVSGTKLAYVLRDLEPATIQSLNKIMADFPEQKAHECGKN